MDFAGAVFDLKIAHLCGCKVVGFGSDPASRLGVGWC